MAAQNNLSTFLAFLVCGVSANYDAYLTTQTILDYLSKPQNLSILCFAYYIFEMSVNVVYSWSSYIDMQIVT